MKKAIALGILSLTLATAASAQVKPEDQIKFRQAGYSFKKKKKKTAMMLKIS